MRHSQNEARRRLADRGARIFVNSSVMVATTRAPTIALSRAMVNAARHRPIIGGARHAGRR
jgi:hypothetical protein